MQKIACVELTLIIYFRLVSPFMSDSVLFLQIFELNFYTQEIAGVYICESNHICNQDEFTQEKSTSHCFVASAFSD